MALALTNVYHRRSSPILITIFDSCIREPERPSSSSSSSTLSHNRPAAPPALKRKSSDETTNSSISSSSARGRGGSSSGSGIGMEMSILHGQDLSDIAFDGSTSNGSSSTSTSSSSTIAGGLQSLLGSLWGGSQQQQQLPRHQQLRQRDGGRITVTGTEDDWRDDAESADGSTRSGVGGSSITSSINSPGSTSTSTNASGTTTTSTSRGLSIRQAVLGRPAGYSHLSTDSPSAAI